MPEQAPRPEEAENNPEERVRIAAEVALSAVERTEAADRPEWRKNAVKYVATGGRIASTSIGLALAIIPKIVFGVLGFAKKLALSEGKVSFKEGREMGEEMFSFEGKREKK